MNFEAVLSVKGDQELILKVFEPELKEMKAERAAYTIKKSKEGVVFELKANDAVAFRAMLNSITKNLGVIEKLKVL